MRHVQIYLLTYLSNMVCYDAHNLMQIKT